MNRRAFVAGLGAGGLLQAAAVSSAPGGAPLVGLLLPGSRAAYGRYLAPFEDGLREAGSAAPHPALEVRFADGQATQFPVLARELVGLGARVIAVGSTGAALATAKAVPESPLVFLSGNDPVAAGLVDSISKPAGLATGVHIFNSAIMRKRLALLIELTPEATTVGLLVNPRNPNGAREADEAVAAAREVGRQAIVARATSPGKIETAIPGTGSCMGWLRPICRCNSRPRSR